MAAASSTAHTKINLDRLLRSCDALGDSLADKAARRRFVTYLTVLQRYWHDLDAAGESEVVLGEYRRRIERLAELVDEGKMLSGVGSALALSQAILLWIQNYQLKHRHLHDVINLLPPIQTMESTLFDLISISMVLLTLAIGTGFIFVDDFFAQHLLHKTVFALGAWAVLWLLLFGRNLWGWRGMVAVKWTMTGFVLLTLGYFGSKVMLEVILNRV